jgi:penicillin-binding protein 1A
LPQSSVAAANSPQPPATVAGRPAPTRASVRPEAASGLDGWLIDRLFGR